MKPPVIGLAFANERTEEGFLRNLGKEMKLILRALDPVVQPGDLYAHLMPAVTSREIQNLFQNRFFEGRVSILHYGGHATPTILNLERDSGGNESFFSEGLARFLAVQKGIRLVFLNGCSTENQARRLIQENIPAVIATSQKIPDEMAVMFAEAFYKGLTSGASIEESFKEADGYVIGRTGTARFLDSATRGLFWEDEPGIGDLDLPWKLFLKEEASWFPAQWRLVHQAKEIENSGITVEKMPQLEGRILEKHLIYETLGYGTTGMVYRAQQVEAQEDRAFKITYHIESGFKAFYQSMIDEFEALQSLNHPNIARVLDVGAIQRNGQQQLFISMELLKGKRLDSIPMKGRTDDVVALGIDICSGIAAAHRIRIDDLGQESRQGIVHGNLMTRKIFLDRNGTARIIDFLFTNLARLPQVSLRRPIEAENKLREQRLDAYFAPELLRGEASPNVQTDIYSIGAILLEKYIGKPVHECQFHDLNSLTSLIETELGFVSKRLAEGIFRALADNPSHRWTSADDLRKHLIPALGWWKAFKRNWVAKKSDSS